MEFCHSHVRIKAESWPGTSGSDRIKEVFVWLGLLGSTRVEVRDI